MPNGKPGDHPLTDIMLHRLRVYLSHGDELACEIVRLGGREEIADMLLFEYSPYQRPDIKRLEAVLTEIRDRLYRSAQERGWEL